MSVDWQTWWLALLAAVVTAAVTALAVRHAARLGLLEDPRGGLPAWRRRKGAARVPVVGGLGLLAGAACVACVTLLVRAAGFAPDAWTTGLATSSLAAFAVGCIDDRRPGGLRPGPKLFLQLVAAAPLAAGVTLGPGGVSAGLAWLAAAVVAMNLANTYDNADGALSGLGALALFCAGSPLAGVFLGFLPFNLDTSRRPDARGRARASRPSAYLGDSGSHVAGLWLLVFAWPALLVPLLDLARLAWVRIASGGRPWVGDRRHLAHRFLRRGWGRRTVAGLLALVAAPALLGLYARSGAALGAGLSGTTILFLLALGASRLRFPRRGDMRPT